MEKFVYAIPSYNRVQRQTTLEYLMKLGVPKERIWIFVQTEEDYASYQIHAEHANIVMMPATRGVMARNNILNRLKGENILMLDDDVKQIYYLRGKALVGFEKRIDLAFAFNRCFDQTRNLRAKVFGIYPVNNAFFMSDDISTKVAVNTVFGFAAGFPFRFDENFETKEDAELCGRVLRRDGRVVRFNNLAVNADHNKDKNGYRERWHHDENVRSVKKLCARYPDIFAPQKNKAWEVRVRLRDERVPNTPFKSTAPARQREADGT